MGIAQSTPARAAPPGPGYNLREAAQALGCSERAIYKWLDATPPKLVATVLAGERLIFPSENQPFWDERLQRNKARELAASAI